MLRSDGSRIKHSRFDEVFPSIDQQITAPPLHRYDWGRHNDKHIIQLFDGMHRAWPSLPELIYFKNRTEGDMRHWSAFGRCTTEILSMKTCFYFFSFFFSLNIKQIQNTNHICFQHVKPFNSCKEIFLSIMLIRCTIFKIKLLLGTIQSLHMKRNNNVVATFPL